MCQGSCQCLWDLVGAECGLCRWTTLACVAATPALGPLWSTWTWWQMHGQVSRTMSRRPLGAAALHSCQSSVVILLSSKLPLMPVAGLADRQLQAMQPQVLPSASCMHCMHLTWVRSPSAACKAVQPPHPAKEHTTHLQASGWLVPQPMPTSRPLQPC